MVGCLWPPVYSKKWKQMEAFDSSQLSGHTGGAAFLTLGHSTSLYANTRELDETQVPGHHLPDLAVVWVATERTP